MGKCKRSWRSKSMNSIHRNQNTRNIAPKKNENPNIDLIDINEMTGNNDNNSHNSQFWWDKLINLSNNNRIRAYSPKWNRLCSECGSQLLSSESRNFCCNSLLRRLIPPLRPLSLALQNLYESNANINFGHYSRQYNSLFSFTTLGYTGGVIHLPHPHAFAINGRAYHQIHSANTRDQNIVNLIEQELAIVNLFIQGLYQLRNTNYPQAQLIIQQPTANAEIAACTIVHSTAIVHERSIQIWRINESKPEYINILNEHYEALQYPLFFPYDEVGWQVHWTDATNSYSHKISQVDYYRYHIMTEPRFHLLGCLFNEYLVDMFSRADDERLQFIHKEQHRFQKGGQEEDESLGDEAELHPNNIYLPASHTLSYRWSYKKTMDALAVVSKLGRPTLFITFTTNPHWQEIQQQLHDGQNYADRPDIVVRVFKQCLIYLRQLLKKYFGKIIYYIDAIEFQKRGLPHAHIIIKSTPNLLKPEDIDKLISAELLLGNNFQQTYLRDLGPDRAMISVQMEENNKTEHKIIDEIKDYLNA
ncbi:7932_t:CDS:2, partial [Cetraspora pellucida]